MMNPEMMRMASEMMSRMTPEQVGQCCFVERAVLAIRRDTVHTAACKCNGDREYGNGEGEGCKCFEKWC